MIESQFEELQAVMERAKREVTEILEGEEKQALKQAEGIRVHLEHRCTELKKTQAQVEKLSKNKNDVDFLQVRSSLEQFSDKLITRENVCFWRNLDRILNPDPESGA